MMSLKNVSVGVRKVAVQNMLLLWFIIVENLVVLVA